MDTNLINAILCALAAGYLVELQQLPDGRIKARKILKKKIELPTA